MTAGGPPMRQSRMFLCLLFVVGLALPLAAQPFPPPLHEPFTLDSLWTQLHDGNLLLMAGAIPYTHRDDVREAVILNAKASADYVVSHSKVIGSAVRSGEVKIIVAYYNLTSGEVTRIK